MTGRAHSPLALVVLALLAEAPMHPYRMQQLIKERGKDQIANVAQRNSVYQTIGRLERAGLIAVRETAREEGRPERTVYEITDAGRATFTSWVRTMLSARAREFPEFPAALSVLMLLEPEDVLRQLETRAGALEAELASSGAEIPAGLPRLFLLDDEYRDAVTRAELRWVRSVIDDLRSGRLTWNEELLRRYGEPGS
ncbi:MAG TPA: PadR family transcriptional regulator [Actinophytocola sp.]|uniref:PadR family transcriptional regulator n=1 Tax=Actinophytocola sp. TaxID=1872138 RepID=UPI002DDD843C|nr:PadR family transcriptional regulator [Actinophytocola sp.]HEV2779758.1 PadR family transcriptional regulator [Actinophytocola sp.]